MPFRFDDQEGFDTNWRAFIEHLAADEPAFAALLAAAGARLYPLPPPGAQRNQLRLVINTWLVSELDRSATPEI